LESSDVFTNNQPQYPDLQGYFNADFTVVQEIFNTTRSLPHLTRRLHDYYSVDHQRQAANEADQIRPTVYKTHWDTNLAGPQEIIVRADVPNSFQTT